MGRTSSVALVALTLLLSSTSLWAQSKRGSATKKRRTPPPVVAPAPTPAPPISTLRTPPPRSIQVISPRWSLGYTLWTEKLSMRRDDGEMYEIWASIRSLSAGYQIDWLKKERGWFIDFQSHLGDTTSASQDPDLTYTHSGAGLVGLSGTVVSHWNFEKPRLSLGLGISSLWRMIQFKTPSGYKMGQEQGFVHHAKIDLSFPVGTDTELFHQFGVPLDKSGHFWQFGLRFR